MSLNLDRPAILNVSAYKFVALDAPDALRQRLHARAESARLKGTILLAGEGINLFLAGEADALHGFVDELRSDDRFCDLEPTESWSARLPFKHLRVKVKREIIRMNNPTVRPQARRAPAVSPETLARWLDQGRDDDGRDVVLLDTRNAFEVDRGAFVGAIDWRIARFSEFPQALDAHRDELRGKTVVSYCTGGIRCEKAALLMADVGLAHVLQLDGGILKYLESHQGQPGARHFEGDCFVFDERVAVDADLKARPESTSVRATEHPIRARALPSATEETT